MQQNLILEEEQRGLCNLHGFRPQPALGQIQALTVGPGTQWLPVSKGYISETGVNDARNRGDVKPRLVTFEQMPGRLKLTDNLPI